MSSPHNESEPEPAPSITKSAFRKACKAFVGMQPRISEAKEALKVLKKESGTHVKVIKQYMNEQRVMEMDVSGFTFASEEKEQCRWNEDNLLTVLDDTGVLERYKEEFTTTKTAFRIKPPKRARTEPSEE